MHIINGVYGVHVLFIFLLLLLQVGGPFLSMRTTFWHVYHARGSRLRGLFNGAHVNYTRALVSWGIINASYEMLHKLLYS